ncbi:MAG: protein kinase [Anaerolineales bacterium]
MFDLDQDQGKVFLIMQYMAGGNLKDWVAKHGPLKEAQLIRILENVAGALDYIHEQGVYHRDVKPTNILMDPLPCCLCIWPFVLLCGRIKTRRASPPWKKTSGSAIRTNVITSKSITLREHFKIHLS